MNRIVALAAFAAAFAAGPTFAQAPAAGETSQVVRFADLDLATGAGRAELDRRVHAAVRAVCGEASDADPAGRNAVRRCREELNARLQQRASAVAAAWRGARETARAER